MCCSFSHLSQRSHHIKFWFDLLFQRKLEHLVFSIAKKTVGVKMIIVSIEPEINRVVWRLQFLPRHEGDLSGGST